MEFVSTNLDDLFVDVVKAMCDSKNVLTVETRNGPVTRMREPVVIKHEPQQQFCLLNAARDANPFFHLIEAAWMLSGSNQVAPLVPFNSKIGEVASDDGASFNGAYGHRWRHATGFFKAVSVNQLSYIGDHIRRNNNTRRAVLQMWTVKDDLMKIEESKDVCCNTNCYFSVVDNKLSMTVCNRSNDLVWGALGANVVHFHFLHQFMSELSEMHRGPMYQFTNDLHAYEWNWKPADYINTYTHTPNLDPTYEPIMIHGSELQFYKELDFLMSWITHHMTGQTSYPLMDSWLDSPFLGTIIKPAMNAYISYKNDPAAITQIWKHLSHIASLDWQRACTEWLSRRLIKKGTRVHWPNQY